MLRTIVLNLLLRNTIKRAIRTNITRTLSVQCSRQRFYRKQNSLLVTNQRKPWLTNSIRFYADLPEHLKVPLPALSPTMDTGKIVSWAKKEGDKLNEGDLLCEIETDKATMGFETPEEGYLAKIIIPAGSADVKVGLLVCIIVQNEADVAAFKDFKADSTPPPVAGAPPTAAAPTPAPSPAPSSVSSAPSPSGPPGMRVYASPLARKMAASQGIELSGSGSGVYGSITSKDLGAMKPGGGRPSPMAAGLAQAQAARAGPPAPIPSPTGGFVDIPLTNMRQVIAKRLLESKTTIPHFYLTINCNVDKMLAMRKKVNKTLEKHPDAVKISVNDFILKAVACASMAVPEVNSYWLGDKIRQFSNVDISVAVSTPAGLITPIIFNANGKGITQISREMKALAKKARDNTLKPAEFQGGTITVSNLGMFGTHQFAAIINPPQSVILAVGTNETQLVIDKDSDRGFRAAEYVSFTMSGDHRVVDGALGAIWMKALKGYIEDPATMIL